MVDLPVGVVRQTLQHPEHGGLHVGRQPRPAPPQEPLDEHLIGWVAGNHHGDPVSVRVAVETQDRHLPDAFGADDPARHFVW